MDSGRKWACGKTGRLAGMALARDGTEQGSGITAGVWACARSRRGSRGGFKAGRECDWRAGGAAAGAASCERGDGGLALAAAC